MILLTGWSQKLDGVAFVADTDDQDEALRMFCADWNDRFSDKTKVVYGNQSYLLFAEVEDSAIADFEDEIPRREGWQIVAQKIEIGGVIQSCPW